MKNDQNAYPLMNEGLVLHIVLEDIGKGAPVFSLQAARTVLLMISITHFL